MRLTDPEAFAFGILIIIIAAGCLVLGLIVGFMIGSIRSERESSSAYNVGVTRQKIRNIEPAQNG